MTHEEMQKTYYKACAHKILPCHFCGVPAIVVTRFCLGCGAVVCLDCSDVRAMPGDNVQHTKEAHVILDATEIRRCWKCSTRIMVADPEADLCQKCEAERLGGGGSMCA